MVGQDHINIVANSCRDTEQSCTESNETCFDEAKSVLMEIPCDLEFVLGECVFWWSKIASGKRVVLCWMMDDSLPKATALQRPCVGVFRPRGWSSLMRNHDVIITIVVVVVAGRRTPGPHHPSGWRTGISAWPRRWYSALVRMQMAKNKHAFLGQFPDCIALPSPSAVQVTHLMKRVPPQLVALYEAKSVAGHDLSFLRGPLGLT